MKKLMYLAILLTLGVMSIHADDLLIFKDGSQSRCEIKAYRNGLLIVIGQNGEEFSGKLSSISEIVFDHVPETDWRKHFDAPTHSNKSNTRQETISIEKLNTFPEEYIGSRVTFTSCEIDQELSPTELPDFYSISVTSKGGEYITPILLRQGIAFVVSKNMAKKISNDIEGGFIWPNCTLSCTIRKYGNYHVAVVTRLDIHNNSGEIAQTYR